MTTNRLSLQMLTKNSSKWTLLIFKFSCLRCLNRKMLIIVYYLLNLLVYSVTCQKHFISVGGRGRKLLSTETRPETSPKCMSRALKVTNHASVMRSMLLRNLSTKVSFPGLWRVKSYQQNNFKCVYPTQIQNLTPLVHFTPPCLHPPSSTPPSPLN